MIDLATATCENFVPQVGNTFSLFAANGQCDLMLKEAKISKYSGGKRQSFSLIFSSPSGVNIEQGIYTIENGELGRIDLFLVPIGIENGCIQMQAVFT